jgi:hypothetical protein
MQTKLKQDVHLAKSSFLATANAISTAKAMLAKIKKLEAKESKP